MSLSNHLLAGSTELTIQELAHLDGVTSSVQAQIDSKAADADVVKKADAQTITGDKTITGQYTFQRASDNIPVFKMSSTSTIAWEMQDSDGTAIAQFRREGSSANQTLWYRPQSNWGVRMAANTFAPSVDNQKDLGTTSKRWDDVRATNSNIQTSDRTEKQDIEILNDSELMAARAISTLFRTFRWTRAITDKGDAARTHTGAIAQDVETVLVHAGLDPNKYAFLVKDTYALFDGETIETSGKEAEALPEGAVEYTHYSLRMTELLSFVAAGTEQRLTALETAINNNFT
jgi:hypothetical protein